MKYYDEISKLIKIDGMSDTDIAAMLAPSQRPEMGDVSLACFRFAKEFKMSPQAIAEKIAADIPVGGLVAKVECVGGYLNIFLSREKVADEVKDILKCGADFGRSNEGNGKTICIDYSSVNIAKPFHIGHLSTTVLGAALYRIFGFLGYKTVGINHLGDWGTQFGKLIVAYKKWGDRKLIESGGITELNKIYVKFHEEAKEHPELEDEARAWFKRIEDGDSEATELFLWFKELTLIDVEKIYKRLNIQFDSYNGESFYNDKMQPVLDALEKKGLLKTDDGAKIVDLSDYNMPPCMIVKADGATLYATRDLAAAFYRKQTYDFYKCLYVVAYQQNLHFKQFFKVLELMDCEWAKDMVHVAFGMVSLEEGSMSTRSGRVVWLKDVLFEAVKKAGEIIAEKSPDIDANTKAEIAEKVGVGAVVFSALWGSRIKDIVFSYDKILNFDGETSPYIQYTHARCMSVLKKASADLAGATEGAKPADKASKQADKASKLAKSADLQKDGKVGENEHEALFDGADFSALTDDESFALIKTLLTFPDVLKDAAEKYEPFFVSRFLITLSECYNKFYLANRILNAPDGIKQARLALTKATANVLKTGLSLLGIEAPDKM